MSISAAQYDKFNEQAVAQERVYTFTDGGELLVYPLPDGETVPFWSSRSRLETIQRRISKYQQWDITEVAVGEFWRILDQLEGESRRVGVNWSGQQLVGYNVPVARLRESLLYRMEEQNKRRLIGLADDNVS